MTTECDNTSVGVILRDEEGKYALLRRGKFPVGMAPPAGHIDEHGSPEQTAVGEVHEELGIELTLSGLRRTVIANRRVGNRCRQPGGDYHNWTVYEATVPAGAPLKPSTDETKGAGWYNPDQLEQLADRTRAFHAGQIPAADWEASPGLEEVWLSFLEELGHLRPEG